VGVLSSDDKGVESVGAPKAGENRASYAIAAHPVYLAADLQRPIFYVEEVFYSVVGK